MFGGKSEKPNSQWTGVSFENFHGKIMIPALLVYRIFETRSFSARVNTSQMLSRHLRKVIKWFNNPEEVTLLSDR